SAAARWARGREMEGDGDSSGGLVRKLKRVQTRPAVQHWSRRLSAGPPTPRMKRVFGRRENARRKNHGGSLTPAAQTPRLPIRKQIPSPSSPRARATHGDRDSSGGSFRRLKRVQTRPAVQHWSRRLSAGPPTPRMKRDFGRREKARRKNHRGSFTPAAPTPRL